ncbi:Crp/Fnr family transcriptional regulator [Streptomyces sp. NBC_00588]|jgi:CRP-like cAMP-binding protein|uniref:Crp/Fnr family transcriptional regulator n=1 Tax=Streptomyces sp. NBC_00588 TaxID=2975784 RepID=UPI002E80971B|nr:cyclic nucleotide-binding domain-containing protein [Streptomyces sp. NBC_00588]WUB33831.1 cyclic nucleotide-binding domain-containing protein [Streptomyces sp. NBC_00588]
MTTAITPRTTRKLPAVYRGRLMGMAHDVRYPPDTRLFDEGGRADHFWIIESGTVSLDMHVPGRRAAVIDTVGPGELLGWSWLYQPHRWRFGARTVGPVRAHEFDAEAVRRMCEADPEMGRSITLWVGEAVARRLNAARTRLLDLYAPYGSGARG